MAENNNEQGESGPGGGTPMQEILRRDIEEGILFLNGWEKDCLDMEEKLRSMDLEIGDKDRPSKIPSLAVRKVFVSRSASKSVRKGLGAVGLTLGTISATKRELVNALKNATAELFPQDEYEIDEITGQIIWLKDKPEDRGGSE